MGLLTVIGLTLDIGGVILIYIFTIEPQIGAIMMDNDMVNQEKFKRKLYKFGSIAGLIAIVIGFLLQIIDNFLQL